MRVSEDLAAISVPYFYSQVRFCYFGLSKANDKYTSYAGFVAMFIRCLIEFEFSNLALRTSSLPLVGVACGISFAAGLFFC